MLIGAILNRLLTMMEIVEGSAAEQSPPLVPSRMTLLHLTLFRVQLLAPGEDGEAKL